MRYVIFVLNNHGFAGELNENFNDFRHLTDERVIPVCQRAAAAVAADGIAFNSLFSPAFRNDSEISPLVWGWNDNASTDKSFMPIKPPQIYFIL